MHAMTFAPAAAEAWLRQPSDTHSRFSRAVAAGIDENHFGRGEAGFLRVVEDILVEAPAGLARRADITNVALWRIPDGAALDQGAIITVDLSNGVRLASLHQDLKDFADRDARGIPAFLSALAHIAAQVSAAVATYETTRPNHDIAVLRHQPSQWT